MIIDNSNVYLQNCNKVKSNTTKIYAESKESNDLEINNSSKKNTVKDTVEITHTNDKPALYYASGGEICRQFHAATKQRIDQQLETIKESMNNYYRGNATMDDIKQAFKEDFEYNKRLETEFSQITGITMQSDEEILMFTVGNFKIQSLCSAYYTNYDEGTKLANEYGSSKDHDWMYYNADYYYLSKDVDDTISLLIDEVIEENNLNVPDKTKLYPEEGTFKNFNSMWNLHSDNVFHTIQDFSIINEDIEPPEGFNLFYKNKQCSFDDMMNGTVYAICGTDPFAGQDGDGSVTWYFTVPRGKSLLKEKSIIDYILLSDGKRTGGDYNAIVIDLDKYLYKDGYTENSLVNRINDFVRQKFNNYNDGVMIIGDDSFEKTIEVPYLLQGSRTPDMKLYNFMDYGMLSESDTINFNEYNNFLKNFNLKLAR